MNTSRVHFVLSAATFVLAIGAVVACAAGLLVDAAGIGRGARARCWSAWSLPARRLALLLDAVPSRASGHQASSRRRRPTRSHGRSIATTSSPCFRLWTTRHPLARSRQSCPGEVPGAVRATPGLRARAGGVGSPLPPRHRRARSDPGDSDGPGGPDAGDRPVRRSCAGQSAAPRPCSTSTPRQSRAGRSPTWCTARTWSNC